MPVVGECAVAYGGQKRTLDPLETEVEAVVSHSYGFWELK